jgi:rhodanese-related sulfurtransferase
MIRNNENINIIDVRSAEDFDRGHIPGAMSLPEGTWRTTFGLSKDRVNVIYCYSEACHLAAHAAKYFAEHRFSVMELEGGFEEWERHSLPIVE